MENGDILRKINDQWIDNFDKLVNEMNNNVGGSLSLEIERDGEIKTDVVGVTDLNQLDDSTRFQIAGGNFQGMPYRYAKDYNLPLEGVCIGCPGPYFERGGLKRNDIICRVGDNKTPTLEQFISTITNRENNNPYAQISYLRPAKSQVMQYAVPQVSSPFFKPTVFERQYGKSHWDITELKNSDDANQKIASQVTTKQTSVSEWRQSLVQVEITLPFSTAAVSAKSVPQEITGVVVDSKKGLVLINSYDLPTPFADIQLVFPDTTELPATVYKQHPKLPLTLLMYSPESLTSDIASTSPVVDKLLETGQKVKLITLDQYGQIKITDNQLATPFRSGNPVFPHAKKNPNEYSDVLFANPAYPGVIVDDNGKFIALNIPENPILLGHEETIILGTQIQKFLHDIDKEATGVTDLGIGVRHIPAKKAKRYGIPQEYLKNKPDDQYCFMEVSGIDQAAPAKKVLEIGDILLKVGESTVYGYPDLEKYIQAISAEEVEVTYLRRSTVLTQTIETINYPFEEFNKVVNWQGMVLHKAPRAFREINELKHSNLYITDVKQGSPAKKAHAKIDHCIIAVNGEATADLEAFMEKLSRLSSEKIIKLRIMSIKTDKLEDVDVRPNHIYWPTTQYERTTSGYWDISTVK